MLKKIGWRFFPLRATISSNKSPNMQRLSVRSVQKEERIQISFLFGLEGKKQRVYNLDRLKSEELSKTLERLSTNVNKILVKKSKKKNSTAEDSLEPISVVLLNTDSTKIQEDVPNGEAWKCGRILEIGSTKFEVSVNPPLIRSIKLSECILSGYPIFPNIDAEFVDLESCKYVWYKSSEAFKNKQSTSIDETDNNKGEGATKPKRKKSISESNDIQWTEIHKGYSYIPNNTEIGYKLKVICTPSDGQRFGTEKECISKFEVTAGPGYCPFESRHALTQKHTDKDSLRVVCYNLLADIYADSDFSRGVLFPYCPPYALAMDYRKHLLLKELSGYNADLLCLQEVDRKVFLNDLYPSFEQSGFEGLMKEKSSDVREGMATFFRKSKFRLIDQHDIKLQESLQEEACHSDLWGNISKNEGMKEKMEQRSTILQVTVLESVEHPNKYLIVGTTHLYFHPRANNVRLIQAFVCVKQLEKLSKMYMEQGKDATLILSGDLNSNPLSGAIQLLNTGRVPATHADWYSGGSELLVEQLDLSHDLKLTSACGFPDYTNYVTSFHGCIDYIFIEKEKLKVSQVVPLPSHEEVVQYTALPNPVFPSDHLALVCDLTWTS